jgi:hypothetical protein
MMIASFCSVYLRHDLDILEPLIWTQVLLLKLGHKIDLRWSRLVDIIN